MSFIQARDDLRKLQPINKLKWCWAFIIFIKYEEALWQMSNRDDNAKPIYKHFMLWPGRNKITKKWNIKKKVE